MKKQLKSVLAIATFTGAATAAYFTLCRFLVRLAIERKPGNGDPVPRLATSREPDPVSYEIMVENYRCLFNDAIQWREKVEAESVVLKSGDGLSLDGVIYKNDSDKWAVVVHGYASRKENMSVYAQHYWDAGFNVLVPDMRAHGESDGKYIGMGWREKDDLYLWINYILMRDPGAKIVLHGISMGGATVLMISGDKLPENVRAIVEDCGYTGITDVLENTLNNYLHLNSGAIMKTTTRIAKRQAGYDWREGDTLAQVKKSVTPTLFIHGGNDNFVPTSMVFELYRAAACPKDIFVVPDAIHAASSYTEPEKYWRRVFDFIFKYI
ncbi:MAG: alpha/beta hydrolase [Oscillospiraceae bacterium]|jgi:fermentation-respiration switch protein FrsA (DUF1100 family)